MLAVVRLAACPGEVSTNSARGYGSKTVELSLSNYGRERNTAGTPATRGPSRGRGKRI